MGGLRGVALDRFAGEGELGDAEDDDIEKLGKGDVHAEPGEKSVYAPIEHAGREDAGHEHDELGAQAF